MPKQSPIPDALDKAFYDACNEERLVIQYCGNCRRYQFPPRPGCSRCGNNDSVEWRQLNLDSVVAREVPADDTGELRALVEDHHRRTGSVRAAAMLADWEPTLKSFRQIVPMASINARETASDPAILSTVVK